ncbi:MAG TPA: N-acyl homoserine lactonase family protein [Burkholderiales bacterium]|nr:N-acyl homoserine lactonase family protein [Burkholderiales bacterium]
MNVSPIFSACRFGAACVAAALVAIAAHAGETGGGVQRMYVLQCGESRTNDVSMWSPGVDVGKPREFSNNCYLIRHEKGLMLWDAGMSDAIAALPEGMPAAGGLLTMRVTRTLASQLDGIGVAPTDIGRIAFSHFHADHCGNANLFTAATLYIQEAEYEAAFGPNPSRFGFNPVYYDQLRANPVVRLRGDHDVFGDGSVVILSTPGHTPGHQSLLVRLPKTGAVVLSGDAVHFQENWIHRRVPARNYDREQSLQSMEKIAAVLAESKARLWINHDKAQSAGIPHAPDYME